MILTGIDQLWLADITYIRLQVEFVYGAARITEQGKSGPPSFKARGPVRGVRVNVCDTSSTTQPNQKGEY